MLVHNHYETEYGMLQVGVKVAMAVGEVEWAILRAEDDSRATFYFRGEAINACAEAEKYAPRNDLVLHPSAQAFLADAVTTAPLADDYARVAEVLAAPTSDLLRPSDF